MLPVLIVLALLAAASGLRGFVTSNRTQRPGGPWSLTDTSGRTVTQAAFHGHPTLIYFGYLHCADVCPLTLGNMAAALDRLGPRAADVVPIFVSVDPARDTPALIGDYVAHFSPRIVGLTGTPQQLAPVLDAFHVTARQTPSRGGMADDSYAVDHSALIYLMDGDNRLLRAMAVDDGVAALASQLATALPYPG